MIPPVVMLIKPTVPGAVIRFPSDPRRRVPDDGCEMPTSGADAEHFRRLLLTRELTAVSAPEPTGRESTTPLITR